MDGMVGSMYVCGCYWGEDYQKIITLLLVTVDNWPVAFVRQCKIPAGKPSGRIQLILGIELEVVS